MRILWDIFVAIAVAVIVGIAFAIGLLLPSFAHAQDPKPASSTPRFLATDNDEAWKQLPRSSRPLPVWARVLVGALPRTTGAMLELDYLHRAKNPLGARLGGQLRWAAGDALGCAYAVRYAEADLRRAGLTANDLKLLAGKPGDLPIAERLAVAFARKLSRDGSSVTDEEVAELVKHFGPDQVVAMVHTLAHANFQNRIVLALGVEVETGGPLAPFDPQLDPVERAKVPTPPRPPWQEVASKKGPPVPDGAPRWRARAFTELQKALDEQKNRKPRIAAPALPAKTPLSQVVWTQVSMGHQPAMTRAWFDCMRTFQQEAKLDKVFANSVFWVITRSNECFY
jgi:alkylhydroperoxidase family enzyme